VFTLEAHMSAVKCVTGAGGYIASGGADDLVRCAAAPPARAAPRAAPVAVLRACTRTAAHATCVAASLAACFPRVAPRHASLLRGGCRVP
jgi:hypothetical protein